MSHRSPPPRWFAASLFLAFASACLAFAQPPGFDPGGPRGFGPGGPGGPRGPGFGPRGPGGMGDPNPAGQMVDMYRCTKCQHEFSSPTKPSRCPSCNTLFTFVTDASGKKTVSPERNLRNTWVIGGICLLVTLVVLGGGIFLLVKLVAAAGKKPKKRRKSRRPFDDEDDRRYSDDDRDFDDRDDDDRPRRRRRDD